MFADLASTSARALLAKAKELRSCVRVEPRPFNFKMVSLFGWENVKVMSLLIESSWRFFVRCVALEMVMLFQELTRWSCQYHCTSQYLHFDSPIENTSVSVSFSTISSKVWVTWCSISMAVLRSGVQVEPQTSACTTLLAAVNKAVEPLCEFIFFELRSNVISRLAPFWCSSSGWMSRALRDRQLRVN